MDWGAISQTAIMFLSDYLAVSVGALTGALFAVDRKLDIMGTVALGIVTAYGGGIIRDMLLHDHGFFFMQQADFVIVPIVLGIAVFAFRDRFHRMERLIFYADALSMSLFALAGASKAWSADTGFVLSIVLGILTAVGGGALRDICTGNTPAIFEPGNFYAVSAAVGSIIYTACAALGLAAPVSSVLSVFSAFALTVLSERFGWRTKPGS